MAKIIVVDDNGHCIEYDNFIFFGFKKNEVREINNNISAREASFAKNRLINGMYKTLISKKTEVVIVNE